MTRESRRPNLLKFCHLWQLRTKPALLLTFPKGCMSPCCTQKGNVIPPWRTKTGCCTMQFVQNKYRTMLSVLVALLPLALVTAPISFERNPHFTSIFKRSRKVWFRYITKFLSVPLSRDLFAPKANHLIGCLERVLLNHSLQFFHSRYKRLEIPKCCNIARTFWRGLEGRRTCDIFQGLFSEQEVFPASGQLHHHHVIGSEDFQHFVGKCYLYVFHWIFQTSLDLHINLYFQKLEFSSLHTQCYLGKVAISKPSVGDQDFTFCGQHPEFVVIPPYSHFIINFTTYSCVKSEVMIFFVVQDSGLFDSVPWQMSSHISNLTSAFCLAQKITQLTFLVEVRKIYLISLNVSKELETQTEAHLYDGPTVEAPSLNRNGELFWSKTFQCTLQILMHHQANITTLTQMISWSHVLPFTTSIYFNTDEVKQLYLPYGTNNYVCLKNNLTTETFNVSVHRLSYSGKKDHKCTFGGLVSAEIFNAGYKEHPTLCNDHNRNVTQSPSYYSFTSVFLMVYCYKGLSSLNAQINVSLTNCELLLFTKAKLMDICFENLTRISHHLEYPVGELQKNYTVNVTYMHVTHGYITQRHRISIFYSLPNSEDACFIFHFPDLTEVCDIFVFPKPVLAQKVSFDIQLQGALRHELSEYDTPCLRVGSDERDYGHFLDFLDMVGSPVKADFDTNGTKLNMIHTLGDVIRFPNHIGHKNFRNFFINAKYRSPARGKHLGIFYKANTFASEGWMEFSVSTTRHQRAQSESMQDLYVSVKIPMKVKT